jgi:biopolymer transport protein TolR
MAQGSTMRGGKGRKFKSEINVVPYIDVMLVLLVIFMVVAPMAPPAEIRLPKAGQSTQPPSEYLEIELKESGEASIGVHGRKLVRVKNRQQLSEQLVSFKRSYPDMPLMISADKDIKYDEVVQTIALANKTGIARVGLAAR